MPLITKEDKDMDKIRQFGNQMYYRITRFMYGRNGMDALARTCNWIAIFLLVINLFVQNGVVYLLWLIFFSYSCFRVYSRNIPKRYAENQKFLNMTTVPRKYAKLIRLQWRDRKVSRYYICKSCHQQIRVPKGKGRIEIRCPKCNERFIKKT